MFVYFQLIVLEALGIQMSSKFECDYRQIFGGGLGQLSKYPLLEAVGIQMSSKSECHYRQIFGGGGHKTANTVSLTKTLFTQE